MIQMSDKKQEMLSSMVELILLFFGSFAMFSFSVVLAMKEFNLEQLITFSLILSIGGTIFIAVLYRIFKRKPTGFCFV